MDNKMFCYQCEQTAGCKGCMGNAGVCGKSADTAQLQDQLTGALIGLACAADGNPTSESTDKAVICGLFKTVTNVDFNDESIKQQIEIVNNEKKSLATQFGNYQASDINKTNFDMNDLWTSNEDLRSLKSLILFGLRGISAYAYHAMALGYTDKEVNSFFYHGLYTIAQPAVKEELLAVALKTGEVNLKCMELLDRANTESYGTPKPTKVGMKVDKGPFIIISGHDLLCLKQLLEQTEGKGINIYTHGEMLPAHGYPELKKYSHLKGNFGTAWQNQQKELNNVPAPILFTTNCIMPPKPSYADRVFTTDAVAYPGITHIGENHDFSPIIKKALDLGGYPHEKEFTGINGGKDMTTGFGHDAVLASADKIVQAVKDGDISHFFLVGGCDGAKPGRNYYTDFVKQTPKDTIILTLACGKYRFNDLDPGTIAGFPRILDMGQCNDAYGAIKVALALAEAFRCNVNELPLSMVLSWYEQKAVCILLTLLHLGIKNILLGPSLPAFISPNVLDILVESYNIAPITTPDKDLKRLLDK